MPENYKHAALGTAALISVMTLASTAHAQDFDSLSELSAIYACKAVTDSNSRLACYDKAVESFQTAEQKGEVVTVSKTAIKEVERDAFGFNIPSLPSLGGLFGSKKSEKPKSNATKSNDLIDPIKEAKVTTPTKSPSPPPALAPKPEASDIKKVTLDIRKTTEFGHKKTRFFMTNGQVWEQSDGSRVRIPKVRNGNANTASISKAALGSFFLRVNAKGSAIRVKRVR